MQWRFGGVPTDITLVMEAIALFELGDLLAVYIGVIYLGGIE